MPSLGHYQESCDLWCFFLKVSVWVTKQFLDKLGFHFWKMFVALWLQSLPQGPEV